MDYKEIIGHERIIQSLKALVQKGTISHSFLFEGEEGLGKKMTAKAFSKTILCKEHSNKPCNICSSCIKFDTGNHPDFRLLEPEKGLIKKGDIEDLIKDVATAPFESKRKVFIINDCHKMNREAMNSLLKTLEEPPEYIVIILITSSANNLLPTILSRTMNIKFYPVENEKVVDYLIHNLNRSEMEAKFIAEFTKGSIGKSIEISSSDEFFTKRDEVIEIIDNLVMGDKVRAFESKDFFLENKENIDEVLDLFLFWFRDLNIYKFLGDSNLIINKDKMTILAKESFLDFYKINDIIEKIEQAKGDINRNVNFQLSIETMLLNIGG